MSGSATQRCARPPNHDESQAPSGTGPVAAFTVKQECLNRRASLSGTMLIAIGRRIEVQQSGVFIHP